jgi:hypothetical protein
MCSQVSQSDYFTNAQVRENPQPILEWGGVPIHINSVMDHNNADLSQGKLPVTNSRTAIKRLEAETITPPWSEEGYGTEESFNPGGDSYVKQHLKKRKGERKSFKNTGTYKNATGVRYMKMEA